MDTTECLLKVAALSNEEVVSTVTEHYYIQDIDVSSIKQFGSYEGRVYYFCGVRSLPGNTHGDQSTSNFGTVEEFIVKINKISQRDPQGIQEEAATVMHFLREKEINCSKPVRCKSGQLTSEVSSSSYRAGRQLDRIDETYDLMLLEFMKGRIMYSCSPPKPGIFYRAGKVLGQLNREAKSFTKSIKAIQQRHMEQWDLCSFDFIEPNIELCHFVPETMKIVKECFREFRSAVKPIIPQLTSTVRHGDFNDCNILICAESEEDPSVYELGIIDFGDIMWGPCVFDLGSSLYYFMLQADDPMQVALEVVRGYLSELTLSKSELRLLPFTVKARLVQSLMNARVGCQLNPENTEYLECHAKHAEVWLDKLLLLPLDKLQL